MEQAGGPPSGVVRCGAESHFADGRRQKMPGSSRQAIQRQLRAPEGSSRRFGGAFLVAVNGGIHQERPHSPASGFRRHPAHPRIIANATLMQAFTVRSPQVEAEHIQQVIQR